MAKKYLGESIDIHCGGIDLKFPHHENEIAQSEGASGKKFCSCWLHNGFVNIGDEKMSKSKGNFLTLRGACPSSMDVRAYRYLVVSSQYRNPLSFTEEAMKAAKGALSRLDSIITLLNDTLNHKNEVDDNETPSE
jgi:cysteinyl-tRNA synthetase